jgi:hypothetical protein
VISDDIRAGIMANVRGLQIIEIETVPMVKKLFTVPTSEQCVSTQLTLYLQTASASNGVSTECDVSCNTKCINLNIYM